MTTFAERLIAARVAASMSQVALAGDDLTASYISLLEAGRRSASDRVLAVLAEKLKVSPAYLKYGEDSPEERVFADTLSLLNSHLAAGDTASAQPIAEHLREFAHGRVQTRAAKDAQARTHETAGRLDEAIALYDELVADYLGTAEYEQAAVQAMNAVAVRIDQGALDGAVHAGVAALKALEDAGMAGTDEHIRLGSTVVWAYIDRGDMLHATYRINDLVNIAAEVGTPVGEGSARWNASLVALRRHMYDDAYTHGKRALDLLGANGRDRDLPRLHLHLAEVCMYAMNPREALAHLDKAEPDLRDSGVTSEVARALRFRASAYLLLGQTARAEGAITEAMKLAGSEPTTDSCEIRLVAGDIATADRELDAARAHYQWAAERLEMMGNPVKAIDALTSLAARYSALGQDAEASDVLASALDLSNVRASSPLIQRTTTDARELLLS